MRNMKVLQKRKVVKEKVFSRHVPVTQMSHGLMSVVHGDKVRLECGHELPLVNALCRNKERMKSMPIVSGILNGKEVSVLRDNG